MKTPKVSIIIPVYNAERYLKESLKSLQRQSYKNLEIICVDDGSTDHSLSILEEFQTQDDRFILIKQKNQYAGVARNHGLKKSTGDYVMFLDSDDIFERNMIKTLVNKAEDSNADIIIFGYWRFKKSLAHKRPVRNLYKTNSLCSPQDLEREIFQVTRSLPWDKFIKKSFLDKTNLEFMSTRVNNDVFFNRMIVTQAEKIQFINKRFVNYRIANKNSLQGKVNLNPTDFIESIISIFKELDSRKILEQYRESFNIMVFNDLIAHLKNSQNYDNFKFIFNYLKEIKFFEFLGISQDCPQLENHLFKETLRALISGDESKTLFSLFNDLKNNSVMTNSAEVKIGNFVLKNLRLTY